MTDRPGLTHEEREAIAVHARGRAAYLSLKKLVDQWRAELELQDKADRIVARVIGAIAAVLSVAMATYLLYATSGLVMRFSESPIYSARVSFWYIAIVGFLTSVFWVGLSYATWSVRPALQRMAVYGIHAAWILFLAGLLVAPFVAWLVAS